MITPDVAIGTIADVGFSVSLLGDNQYSSPATINIGLGRYLGVQFIPTNSSAYDIRSWYNPLRYINGIGAGLGVAISSPVTISADPTYQPTVK